MKLKTKILGLEAGRKPIVVLNDDDAEDLGIRALGRVLLVHKKKKLTAIVNTTDKAVPKGVVGVFDEVVERLGLKEGVSINVDVSKFPNSLQYIRNKLKGRKLTYEEIHEIIKDVVEGRLSETEISSFVTALHTFDLDMDEAASLTVAMVETGETLKLNSGPIVDKHSIGGVPGDKTSLLVVPIVASCGVVMPKTSSRAITSAAGTADRAEVLMPVSLDLEEMKTVIRKTNGCIVWGGALHLAPADETFVKVEYSLSIDPLMLPSIMSKKKAVGAEYVVIDLPCGRGTKLKTIGDANLLAKDFIELGKKLNIKVRCAITYGEQPIGYTLGPALEAKEALEVLMRKKRLPDLEDKATHIAGMLLEMTGKKNGQALAKDAIKSGEAEKKMREIIFEQGGNPEIQPDDIEIGGYGFDFISEKNGVILWINNNELVEVARAAGSPKDKGTGIQLYKKLGDPVKKGDKLFTIYTEKARKLRRARKILDSEKIIGVGDKMEMLIEQVEELPVHKKSFTLER